MTGKDLARLMALVAKHLGLKKSDHILLTPAPTGSVLTAVGDVVSVQLDIDIELPCPVALPVASRMQIRHLGELEIGQVSRTATVRSGSRTLTIETIEPREGRHYTPPVEPPLLSRFDAGDLAKALKTARYAIGRDWSRSTFMGVTLFDRAMWATDGHRLARVDLDTDLTGMFIPTGAAEILASLSTGPVAMHLSEHPHAHYSAAVYSGPVVVGWAGRADASSSWQQTTRDRMASPCDVTVIVDRDALLEELAIVAGAKSVTLLTGGGSLHLSTSGYSSTVGDTAAFAAFAGGAAVEVSLDPRYLLQVVRVAPAGGVVGISWLARDPIHSPCRIDVGRGQHIMMPRRHENT